MIRNLIVFLFCFILINPAISSSAEISHRAATNLTVVNYAKNLLLSIVDTNFRGSWVIDPSNWDKVEKTSKKIQRSFNSLAQVKVGSTPREVKAALKTPLEVKNNGKTWIYGIPKEGGTYKELLEVFFDDKQEHVTGIISFNPKNITDDVGVTIGDSIDKMISVYGEPVDEKDFIEDPDNKDYLGLYYLYPRSGIGFLIGQDEATKNLLVYGVLVYGQQ